MDLRLFQEAIASLDVDVLCMQEVDRDQPRSHAADLTELAAAAMGAEHRIFAPALYGTPGSRWRRAGDEGEPGPAYGCALISRLPLHDTQVFRMPAAPVVIPLWIPGAGLVPVREEPRVAIIARVDIAGAGAGADSLTLVGTHLPFVPGWNRIQLRRLLDAVRPRPDPLLLLGDLNLRGQTPARLSGFTSLATAPTFPAAHPRFQLDHLLLRGRLAALGAVAATATPRLQVSDHRPLIIDVARTGGRF